MVKVDLLAKVAHIGVPSTYSNIVFSETTIAEQWLSGRVLDSRPRVRAHRRLLVVVLEQDTFILA